MRLIFEKLTVGAEEGFTFKELRSRDFSCPWHFHPENELLLTLHCPGSRMVGDHIAPLAEGDLVLIGSNLPHLWQWTKPSGPRRQPVHILLVQFHPNFLGDDFWHIPCTHALRQLLQRATVGLHFTGRTRDHVAHLMLEMRAATDLRRLALFLTLLETLASCPDGHPLASPGYTAELNPFHQERMDRVFQYIHARLEDPIHLDQVARLAGFSPGAFSRFFRQHAGRTFPEFVNQLRVARACRLLAETDQKVADIGFACGFTNLSNFNRQFLRLKRLTPRQFRRQVTTGTQS